MCVCRWDELSANVLATVDDDASKLWDYAAAGGVANQGAPS